MSVGPLAGLAASVAGTALAQSKGTDVEQTQTDANSFQRHVQSDKKAENAAGIDAADGEDHETAERDADGRRIWEDSHRKKEDESEDSPPPPESPRCKDVSGQSGTLLDLEG